MKTRLFLVLLALFALLAAPTLALAHGDEDGCEIVTLVGGWARSSPMGAPNGAVFGLLVNLGAEPDMLVSASTPAAEVVELHETIMGDGDVMQMRPVEGGIAVMPDNYLALQPGGLHIMLINLTQPLVAGETLDLTLNFEHVGEVVVTVPIVEMLEGEMGMEATPEAEMTAEPMPASTVSWPEACAKVHVLGAWARPSTGGMPNSAAYALLLNLTDADATLISASAAVSDAVELHEMVMGDGDVMRMQPIEGGVVVPAGGYAQLKPGGMHVMFIGLTQELQPETTMDLMLTFESGEVIELTVPIREPMEGEMPAPGGMSSGG